MQLFSIALLLLASQVLAVQLTFYTFYMDKKNSALPFTFNFPSIIQVSKDTENWLIENLNEDVDQLKAVKHSTDVQIWSTKAPKKRDVEAQIKNDMEYVNGLIWKETK
jgi:hypothetical protein